MHAGNDRFTMYDNVIMNYNLLDHGYIIRKFFGILYLLPVYYDEYIAQDRIIPFSLHAGNDRFVMHNNDDHELCSNLLLCITE